MAQYHPQVGAIWRSRDAELEPEVFDSLPDWMDHEQPDQYVELDIKRLIAEVLDTLTEREVKTWMARLIRDSSPPEAILAIGAGGMDVAVAMGGGLYYMTYPRVLRIHHTHL